MNHYYNSGENSETMSPTPQFRSNSKGEVQGFSLNSTYIYENNRIRNQQNDMGKFVRYINELVNNVNEVSH